ncbi:N-terminal cleavage protein [Opitutaceae bacterium TAV5]|nr:N-terminal cleavage protein [Opitutaceae bacterium TAV5]
MTKAMLQNSRTNTCVPETVVPARPERNRSRSFAAFTLIELLTVVAIIGILAAITLVAVSKVRQAARQVQNASNLRTLGIGSLAYATDNRGRLPATTYDTEGTRPRYTSGYSTNLGTGCRRLLSSRWTGCTGTADYIPSPEVFYGPFTPVLNEGRQPNSFKGPEGGSYLIGYIFYSLLPGPDADGRPPFGYDLANDRIDSGSVNMRTPLYSDMIGTNIEATGFNGPRCTVVYLDGSVRAFPKDKIEAAGSTNARILVMAGIRQ